MTTTEMMTWRTKNQPPSVAFFESLKPGLYHFSVQSLPRTGSEVSTELVAIHLGAMGNALSHHRSTYQRGHLRHPKRFKWPFRETPKSNAASKDEVLFNSMLLSVAGSAHTPNETTLPDSAHHEGHHGRLSVSDGRAWLWSWTWYHTSCNP